jgi:hypothetical protein
VPADLPVTYKTQPDSSPRLEPPSEFPRTASPGREPRRRIRPDPPLGFRPLQRFPGVGQPPNAKVPRPWLVASSGFRNLLTPCSAPRLPALFHAGPAPGVRPPEPCSSRTAVRRFRRRTPLAFHRRGREVQPAGLPLRAKGAGPQPSGSRQPRLQGSVPCESPVRREGG